MAFKHSITPLAIGLGLLTTTGCGSKVDVHIKEELRATREVIRILRSVKDSSSAEAAASALEKPCYEIADARKARGEQVGLNPDDLAELEAMPAMKELESAKSTMTDALLSLRRNNNIAYNRIVDIYNVFKKTGVMTVTAN